MSQSAGLGRRIPPDFDHIRKYPLRATMPQVIQKVNTRLILPEWVSTHDQGSEGACVGFGASMMLAILNNAECRQQGVHNPQLRYDPWWLWDRAKEIDPWADTVPGDTNGTTVDAACQILRDQGHVVWDGNPETVRTGQPIPSAGIRENRWAQTVDEIRTCIAAGIPVVMGTNWYLNFDSPQLKDDGTWWIGEGDLGLIRGGHCYCIYGAWDDDDCVELINSWGDRYPFPTRMHYKVLQRLIQENGEASLVTDR